jgi:hypothetical protein
VFSSSETTEMVKEEDGMDRVFPLSVKIHIKTYLQIYFFFFFSKTKPKQNKQPNKTKQNKKRHQP